MLHVSKIKIIKYIAIRAKESPQLKITHLKKND
jgi:hypothetical protein